VIREGADGVWRDGRGAEGIMPRRLSHDPNHGGTS